MVDVMYGFTGGDAISDAAGNAINNRTGVVYTGAVNSTRFLNTKTVNGITAGAGVASNGFVYSDPNGRIFFYASDFYDTLWVDFGTQGTNVRYAVNPTRVDDWRLAAVSQAVNQAAAAVALRPADIEFSNTVSGIILRSPSGSRFRVTVGNDGALTTTSI